MHCPSRVFATQQVVGRSPFKDHSEQPRGSQHSTAHQTNSQLSHMPLPQTCSAEKVTLAACTLYCVPLHLSLWGSCNPLCWLALTPIAGVLPSLSVSHSLLVKQHNSRSHSQQVVPQGESQGPCNCTPCPGHGQGVKQSIDTPHTTHAGCSARAADKWCQHVSSTSVSCGKIDNHHKTSTA